MRRNYSYQLQIFAGVIAVLSLAGCSQPPAAGFDPSAIVWPVKVAEAKLTSVDDTSEFVATVKSRNSATLQPQVEGQITHIFVKSGQAVRAGDSILQIDPLKQQATVGSQEATRKSRQAALDLARTQRERAQQLFAAGVVAKQDFDQAQTAFDAAQADVHSLDAQVREQQTQLKYYKVVSPFDGFVGDVPVHEGDRVTTATLLTTVDGTGGHEAYIDVPIEKAPLLHVGLPVELLDENGKVALRTSVTFISPQADSATQSVLAKAAIPSGSSKQVRPAQFVRVRVIWSTRPGLTIPVTAVSRIGGQYFAYIAQSSGNEMKAVQRALKLGPIVNDSYVVLDGLQPGEKMIISGSQNLTEGAKVAVTP